MVSRLRRTAIPAASIVLRRGLVPAGAALLAGAPAAVAQDTSIALGGPAATSLAQQDVTLTAGRPARAGRTRVTLPTSTVTIAGTNATVAHDGTLRLRAGTRSVRFAGIQVLVGTRSALSASVDGSRRTIARISASRSRRSVDAGGTYVTEAPLSLTAATVKLLRRELRRPGLRGGRLGTIDLEVSTGAAIPGTDIPGAPKAPTVTGPPTPGGATLTPRPASAVSITGGSARWSPRSSWLGYLQSGGEGAGAAAPATFDGTAYTLPVTGGWFDTATATAVVTTAGASVFRYTSHTLDMSFSGWSYDLAAATPKAVASVDRTSGVPAGVVATIG